MPDRIIHTLDGKRSGRVFRFAAALTVSAAGAAYMILPPLSTIGLYHRTEV